MDFFYFYSVFFNVSFFLIFSFVFWSRFIHLSIFQRLTSDGQNFGISHWWKILEKYFGKKFIIFFSIKKKFSSFLVFLFALWLLFYPSLRVKISFLKFWYFSLVYWLIKILAALIIFISKTFSSPFSVWQGVILP